MDEWDRKWSLHEMFLCAPCKTSESNITRYQCFDFSPHRLRRQDSICVNLFVGDCEWPRKLQCGIPWEKTRNQSWISASVWKCLRALDSYNDLKLACVIECLIFIGIMLDTAWLRLLPAFRAVTVTAATPPSGRSNNAEYVAVWGNVNVHSVHIKI